MQKEELALIDLELLGQERLAQASADRMAAEASGELALARAGEKLLQAEARIDRVKQQLFFPACKGYSCVLCHPSGIVFTLPISSIIVATHWHGRGRSCCKGPL